MSTNRPRWNTPTKLTVILVLLALFVYLLSRFSIVIAPMVLAMILAYVLSPFAKFLNARLRIPLTLAAVLIYLVLIVLLIALPIVVIPPLTENISDFDVNFQHILEDVEEILSQKYIIAGQVIDPAVLVEQAIGSLQSLIEPLFSSTLTFAVEIIESLVWVIFILIISFYLVKDSAALALWSENMAPPAYRDDFIRIRAEINRIWGAFFRGQLMLALVVSIIFAVVGFIIGLPFFLVMAVLAGLLEFLPTLGHGIWLAIASLLAWFLGSTWLPDGPNWAFTLLVIGLHVFHQQFDLNYLIPRIIGRSLHLSPLVVILGIVAGAALAGVLGIALAAPTIASARVIGRYIYANLFNLDPFPETAAETLPPPNPRWWRLRRRSSAGKNVAKPDNS